MKTAFVPLFSYWRLCFLFISYILKLQVKDVSAQYQQELALKMAQCEVIMTFVEQCSEEYCNMKCGGLCTVTPSTNAPICVCYPGQKKADVSHCAGPNAIGSTDNTLQAETLLCQSGCNEVISSMNPKIYSAAGVCQDVTMGEKPARYCVCVAYYIGPHLPALTGLIPGTAFAKSALASQASSPGIVAASSQIQTEELKVRNGKVLTSSSPASTSVISSESSKAEERSPFFPLLAPEIDKYSNSNTFTRSRRKVFPDSTNGSKNTVPSKYNSTSNAVPFPIIITIFLYIYFSISYI